MQDTGVYEIVCLSTNQRYIGYSLSVKVRLSEHLQKLRNKTHPNDRLLAAFEKYGEGQFAFNLLEFCTTDKLVKRESSLILKFKSYLPEHGFNLRKAGRLLITHGMSKSPTFKSWDAMKQRCTNHNSPDYHRYGAKGVTVSQRWLTSFENFLTDMGERPPGTSLDRYPNKQGNYEPGNCRWATPSEQQRNLRNNQYITFEGRTKLLVDWAAEVGIPIDLLRRRFNRGITGSELFAKAYSRFEGIKNADGEIVRTNKEITNASLFTFNGKTQSITDWANELGVKRTVLAQRLLKYKMPLDKALTSNILPRGKKGPREGHHMITAFGKTQSLTSWSRELNIPVSTLKNRLYRAKMKPEDALRAPYYAKQRGL